MVDFDRGVSPFSGDSDHFWREHPPNIGTGLLILGQHWCSWTKCVRHCETVVNIHVFVGFLHGESHHVRFLRWCRQVTANRTVDGCGTHFAPL